MGTISKILLGIILLVGSAWWILKAPYYPLTLLGISQGTNLADFIIVVNGAIPPLIFLIGLFIIWLEYDELKIQRELAREERKARRKKRRR
jgi:hypothetical protein